LDRGFFPPSFLGDDQDKNALLSRRFLFYFALIMRDDVPPFPSSKKLAGAPVYFPLSFAANRESRLAPPPSVERSRRHSLFSSLSFYKWRDGLPFLLSPLPVDEEGPLTRLPPLLLNGERAELSSSAALSLSFFFSSFSRRAGPRWSPPDYVKIFRYSSISLFFFFTQVRPSCQSAEVPHFSPPLPSFPVK